MRLRAYVMSGRRRDDDDDDVAGRFDSDRLSDVRQK